MSHILGISKKCWLVSSESLALDEVAWFFFRQGGCVGFSKQRLDKGCAIKFFAASSLSLVKYMSEVCFYPWLGSRSWFRTTFKYELLSLAKDKKVIWRTTVCFLKLSNCVVLQNQHCLCTLEPYCNGWQSIKRETIIGRVEPEVILSWTFQLNLESTQPIASLTHRAS